MKNLFLNIKNYLLIEIENLNIQYLYTLINIQKIYLFYQKSTFTIYIPPLGTGGFLFYLNLSNVFFILDHPP
jgi:hypothetical protein